MSDEWNYRLPDEEELQRQIIATWRAQVEEQIRAVTCPIHHTAPSDVALVEAGGGYSLQARYCCEEHAAAIGEILRQNAQMQSGP